MIVLIFLSNIGFVFSSMADHAPGIGNQIWLSPNLKTSSIFDNFDKIIHTHIGDSNSMCALICLERENCTGFLYEEECSKCIMYEKFSVKYNNPDARARYAEFEFYGKDEEPSINGAIYDQTEKKYYLLSGSAVLVYNDWKDFKIGPTTRKHTKDVFEKWGAIGTDGLLVRKMFSSFYFYLFKEDKFYTYNKFSRYPAYKAFSGENGGNVKTNFGNHIPFGSGAMLDIGTDNPFRTTYFFRGSYIFEAWSDTWMSWVANGTSYHITDSRNTRFPGIISDTTAALELGEETKTTLFFKGSEYYSYNTTSKNIKYLGKVKFC